MRVPSVIPPIVTSHTNCDTDHVFLARSAGVFINGATPLVDGVFGQAGEDSWEAVNQLTRDFSPTHGRATHTHTYNTHASTDEEREREGLCERQILSRSLAPHQPRLSRSNHRRLPFSPHTSPTTADSMMSMADDCAGPKGIITEIH